jgi:hypothetical protein
LSPSSFAPSLLCVLTHWYQLRDKKEKIGSVNNHRFSDIKALAMVGRRQGLDALRGAIVRAAKGEQMPEPGYYPIGAGLFTDDLVVETFVRKGLHHQRSDYRIAATYGAAFYAGRSEEVAFLLAERVVLAEGEKMVLQATREALDIYVDTKYGGKCRLCGLTGGSPSTPRLQDLEVRRAS